MLKFSKKVEYALIAMLHISKMDLNDRATARELSEHYNIPPELLGKVLQKLSKVGFIQSVKGVRGGYQLQRPLDKLNIDDIVKAVDGPIRIVNCVEEDHDSCACRQSGNCNIRSPMDVIQKKLEYFFKKILLSELKSEIEIEDSPVKRIEFLNG